MKSDMEKALQRLQSMAVKAKKYDELAFIQRDGTLHCSFCGKRQEDVKKLIISATTEKVIVGICDECVSLCNEILSDEENIDANNAD